MMASEIAMDALRGMVDSTHVELKRNLLSGYMHKSISKSSNQVSNLMDEVKVEQIVEFIREARWV